MAIIEGASSGYQTEVDTTHKAVRTSSRPDEALTWISVGATSGLVTTLAAGAAVFSFRNIGSNLIVVRRITVGFLTTTAFTAAQPIAYQAFFARGFSASDTGGTAIAITANQNKMRTSLNTPTNLDMRISTTAALGAGTRTLDTVALGITGGGSTGLGTGFAPQPLFSHDAGDYPLVLANNEGIVIANTILMGAVGVGNVIVNIEFAEMTSY